MTANRIEEGIGFEPPLAPPYLTSGLESAPSSETGMPSFKIVLHSDRKTAFHPEMRGFGRKQYARSDHSLIDDMDAPFGDGG
jgi:hypothetical protein